MLKNTSLFFKGLLAVSAIVTLANSLYKFHGYYIKPKGKKNRCNCQNKT